MNAVCAMQQDIARCEQRRCDALLSGDMSALATLLTPDLVHIHANGKAEDLSAYLHTSSEVLEFVAMRREALQIRAVGNSGDVAVATGVLCQAIRVRATGQQIDMRIATTQVWQLSATDGQWRLSSFHATNIA